MTQTLTEAELFLTNRSMPVADFPDDELVAELMREDGEMGYGVPDYARYDELTAEVRRRFGADATEHTATKSVLFHYGSEDLVRWAMEGWEDCRLWLTGAITGENYTSHPFYHGSWWHAQGSADCPTCVAERTA